MADRWHASCNRPPPPVLHLCKREVLSAGQPQQAMAMFTLRPIQPSLRANHVYLLGIKTRQQGPACYSSASLRWTTALLMPCSFKPYKAKTVPGLNGRLRVAAGSSRCLCCHCTPGGWEPAGLPSGCSGSQCKGGERFVSCISSLG